MIFAKAEKRKVLERKGRAIFNFRGSQNPPFRATAIAGLPADTLTQGDNKRKGDVR